MQRLSWLNRPDSGPVTLSNHSVSRAPPLPRVAGNVLVFPERFFLTQISAFAAGRDSRATATHPGIHLFPSGELVTGDYQSKASSDSSTSAFTVSALAINSV
jgi:hypothetical protein